MRATKEDIILYLSEIKSYLQGVGITQIGLFGSYSRGEEGVYSDIDIAIRKDVNYLKTRTAYDYFDEVAKVKSLIRKKFHRNSD